MLLPTHDRTRVGHLLPLVLASTACVALLIPCHLVHAQKDADQSQLNFRAVDDESVGLWENEQPILVYNYGRRTLPDVPAAGSRSSYLHPIYGLDGEVLTDDFPADHYHHHGLFWGWPHVVIGDREYDLWKMRGIRFEFQRWLTKNSTAVGATLGVENGWFVRDRQVMKEEVWLQVHPATEDGRNIDITLKWTPLDDPITLGGAQGKSYGGFSLRFAPRTGTIITVPTGHAAEDLLVTAMPWADLSATFHGAKRPSGAAVFVDPRHPDFPPQWMTRGYGLLAVGWPGVDSRQLPADEPVTCRYRLWIHRGTVTAAEVESAYNLFRIELESSATSP